MAVRSGLALHENIRQLDDQIEQWRKSRAHLCAMPAELWAEAAALARVHGIYAIARTLRVSYDSLKKQVGKQADVGRRDQSHGQRFVELRPGAPMFGMPTSGTVVEITNGAGDTLAVRLPADAHLDVGGLAVAFIARRP